MTEIRDSIFCKHRPKNNLYTKLILLDIGKSQFQIDCFVNHDRKAYIYSKIGPCKKIQSMPYPGNK